MRELWQLLRVVVSILVQRGSPTRDYPEQERIVLEKDEGRPMIEVALYQTTWLTKRRGRAPEQTCANIIAQALDEAGFDYRVETGYKQTFEPAEELAKPEVFDWWVEESPEFARNSNILLFDNRGGGRAGLGGKNAVIGMNRVTRVEDARVMCESESCDNAWAAVHELGHNLGGRHSTPMMQGKPSLLFSENMVELLNERFSK